MEQLYIPRKRARLIKDKREIIEKVARLCNCRISIGPDDTIEIYGDAFSEFSAKNILYAFGRGFDIEIACKLNDADYYFASIDLEQLLSSEKRIKQLKSRIIGREGRSKKYIEGVSGARLSIYGDTVSFVGTVEEINEAETAVNTLIEGGTHRVAYMRMEAAHRKNRRQTQLARF
jgi:ribosomal RNA assembly protein